MKFFNAFKTPGSGLRTYRGLVVILVFLGLTAYFLLPVWASSGYDSLRLYTEAMFEITQKYVWPKPQQTLIDGSLRGMVNSLDPDCSFLTAKEYQACRLGDKSCPAEAGLVLIVQNRMVTVASVIDGSPAARAGIKPGDHILKIDGKRVHNLTTQEANRRFQGAPNTQIKLQVYRNNAVKPLDFTVTLEPLGVSTVTTQYLDHGVVYIRISYFNTQTPTELAAALNKIKEHKPPINGIVLDLRNNARGTLEEAVRSASLLLGDQKIVIAKGRLANTEETFTGNNGDRIFKKLPPMVVLVDHWTARAAEIMAGALQDQVRVTLLGTKTMGLCGLTKTFPLEDGSVIVMTVARCYTPRGDIIQGKGLKPTVPGVKPKAEAEKQAPTLVRTPETDPWVQQAVGLFTSGKAPATVKEKAS